jgi:uncharacterized protein YhaN
MQRDLQDFERTARALAEKLAPDLLNHPAPEVSQQLSAKLAKALDDQRELHRLDQDLRRYRDQHDKAKTAVQSARETLVPWLHLAGVADIGALHEAVERSDQWRELHADLNAAKVSAESSGDGLALSALAQEVEKTDLSAVAPRLNELASEQQTIRDQLVQLSARLANAQVELSRIAGQDDAARAAGTRQLALAQMADAAERYIKIHVAARLLRWAIDRYRETKQGPMLARASEIFARLTRNSFAKLTIDFDTDPPTLSGLREHGKAVAIPHMSDGSRDQLYLALRLAALELHIEGGRALPFVADDLFVNFDDDRTTAGLEALAELSQTTQVIFLTHHQHLLPVVEQVFGKSANVTRL